jgi:hypothetical protein
VPPRYQQGQLESSRVGTPGIDPSAGKIEGEIAATSTKAVGQIQQIASTSLQNAQSAFTQANTALTAIANRREYYTRLQNQAILQSQLEGMETKAKRAFVKLDSDIKTEFANSPDGALQAAEERGRGVLQGLMPETTDRRVAAMYATKGENALQTFLGGVSSWQPTQKTVNEKIDFDAGNSELEKEATIQGAKGDFSKVMALHSIIESPEYKSRAFKLGTASENQRQVTAQNVLINGVESLGTADPERALKISQNLMKLGLVKPNQVNELTGRLQSQQERLHTLAERARTENTRRVQTTFDSKFDGDMIAAVNNRDLLSADSIVNAAASKYDQLKRSPGTTPEMLHAARVAVEHYQSRRDEVQKLGMESTRVQLSKQSLVLQGISLQKDADAQMQATPMAVALNSRAFSLMDIAGLAMRSKTASLSERRIAVDDAKQAVQEAKAVMDRSHTGAPKLTGFTADLIKYDTLIHDGYDKELKRAKEFYGVPSVLAEIGATAGNDIGVLKNTISRRQVSDQLLQTYRVRDPKVNEINVRKDVMDRFLREVEIAERDNPSIEWNKDKLEKLHSLTQRLMLHDLQAGK